MMHFQGGADMMLIPIAIVAWGFILWALVDVAIFFLNDTH
jgi:hypothetical protein